MSERTPAAFISYSRTDSDFVLRLAEDLKGAGASVWLDQVDILPGEHWDHAVEGALDVSPLMLVVLSAISVNSMNVMDEVSFALEKQKTVIPIVIQDCVIPFRLRRIQYADFRLEYAHGLKALLRHLETHAAASSERNDTSPSATDDQTRRQAEQESQERERLERERLEQAEAERQSAEAAETQRRECAERQAQEQAEREARQDAEAKLRTESATPIALPVIAQAQPVHPQPSPQAWAAAAAYVTPVPAILFLLIHPYSKIPLVRFHAFQSIGFSVVALVALSVAGSVNPYLLLTVLVGLFIVWLMTIVKAAKGQWYKLPVLGDLALKRAHAIG